ncbi:MAG: hypothetical protein RMM06_00025 [Armatimonadota bacterium]|nr:hypothetical protein [bacterium]MDW8105001.1 hypothetical protein [Armatimonadota bacterium]MDW8289079.1 hypothetical protein [Armatimonadota bacterium]
MRALVGPPAVRSAPLFWRCSAKRWEAAQFSCTQALSALVWRLPLTRQAIPYRQLSAPYRQGCGEALQRVAQGYVQAQHVYYPVPAQAVVRIEIDETRGKLYAYPRATPHRATASACVWIVVGKRLADGRAVRAIWRGE